MYYWGLSALLLPSLALNCHCRLPLLSPSPSPSLPRLLRDCYWRDVAIKSRTPCLCGVWIHHRITCLLPLVAVPRCFSPEILYSHTERCFLCRERHWKEFGRRFVSVFVFSYIAVAAVGIVGGGEGMRGVVANPFLRCLAELIESGVCPLGCCLCWWEVGSFLLLSPSTLLYTSVARRCYSLSQLMKLIYELSTGTEGGGRGGKFYR